MGLFVYPPTQLDTTLLAKEAKQDVMINELEEINLELDAQTTLITATNIKLDDVNSELDAQTVLITSTNTKLDTANSELADINTELDGQTTLITSTNTKLDDVNSELDAQTTLITSTNTKLDDVNTELDSQTALLTTISTNTNNPDVVDMLDTPLLDVSSTNIPGSASNPVEIVATLADDVTEMEVVEDIGEFIGVYTGAVASETLKTILPLGGGRVKLNLASGERISLRSMTTTAITSGNFAINFLK